MMTEKKIVALPDPSHPLKHRLKKLHIPQVRVAQALGLRYLLLCQMLGGYCQMPPEIEKRLIALLEDIEGGTGARE